MKAYKGFNKDMTCRGFQFEEGKTYETDKAELCNSGFHACEMPLDCFRYYEPSNSVYHEVDLDATDETSNDSKRVGKRIKIGARLDIAGIVKAQFAYVKERCTNNKNGGYRSALNGGDLSVIRGGVGSKFKGGMWAVFACEVRDDRYMLIGMKTAVVDGEAIKPDTWYALKDGEFVEVDDD